MRFRNAPHESRLRACQTLSLGLAPDADMVTHLSDDVWYLVIAHLKVHDRLALREAMSTVPDPVLDTLPHGDMKQAVRKRYMCDQIQHLHTEWRKNVTKRFDYNVKLSAFMVFENRAKRYYTRRFIFRGYPK